MTVVSGEKNSWQTGEINGRAHAIEMCGSFTGHAVRSVAFCDSETTAQLLVEALRILKHSHDKGCVYSYEPGSGFKENTEIKALLERAGLL